MLDNPAYFPSGRSFRRALAGRFKGDFTAGNEPEVADGCCSSSPWANCETLDLGLAAPRPVELYTYSLNNPTNYTDPSGHCIFGIDTAACIAIGLGILKVVDYGWTAWDTWQAGQVIADPNASRNDKMMAGLTVGLAILFETIEPDDLFPIGLPLDDIGRNAVMKGAKDALEEGGEEGLEKYLRNQLGDHADDVLKKIGFNTSNFSSPEKLLEHFQKHGSEFGFQTADDYLRGARNLANGGEGVDTFRRVNGDQLFYNRSTNEFTVQSADGVIRTYFKPERGLDYWLDQIR